jgi:hypothetical protein
LINRNLLSQFIGLREIFFDNAWRLMLGMLKKELRPPADNLQTDIRTRAKNEAFLTELRSSVVNFATQSELARALPYPSDNWWILDEIAWQLTLGHATGLTQEIFRADLVAQGEEAFAAVKASQKPVLVHYFSPNEKRFLGSVVGLPGVAQ